MRLGWVSFGVEWSGVAGVASPVVSRCGELGQARFGQVGSVEVCCGEAGKVRHVRVQHGLHGLAGEVRQVWFGSGLDWQGR